jgi:hypothetical protein
VRTDFHWPNRQKDHSPPRLEPLNSWAIWSLISVRRAAEPTRSAKRRKAPTLDYFGRCARV